ncbi:MAG: biopolymer transporter ExbD [Candidatus Gastranaerophilaceae bacterium]
MSIKTAKGKDALFTEINITPLTDIFLVLLIIMMVVAPTFQSMDNSINIPEINSGVSVEQKNATVSVTKEGLMYINGKEIKPENLTSELIAIKDTLEKKEVVVKADEKAKSSEIMKIMDSAKEAEFTKLIMAGEPLSRKEQKKLETQSPEKKQLKAQQPAQEEKTSNWVE